MLDIEGYKPISRAIDESLKMVELIGLGRIVPLRTSLQKEQERIGGFFPSDMCTIAARTGMGKTARVVKMIRDFINGELNPHYQGRLIILFDSWEMVDWRLMLRMYSSPAKLTVSQMLDYNTRITMEKLDLLKQVSEQFRDAPVFISNTSQNAHKWFDDKVKIAKKYPEHQIVCITDHMRLVTAQNERTEEQLITNFSKAQMEAKKQLGCICLPLSQMNRAIEQGARGEELAQRLPQPSDLFGSDAIFQCSDIVIALHRPGYYGAATFRNGQQSIPTGLGQGADAVDNLMIECILKQRDGWVGNILIKHDLKYSEFSDFVTPALTF